MSVANYSGQLWALRAHVSIGDLIALPRKKTRQIAIGVVTREYWYRDDPDPGRRHVVSVDWKRTDVPWEAAHEDLRNSLSSLRTIWRNQVRRWRATPSPSDDGRAAIRARGIGLGAADTERSHDTVRASHAEFLDCAERPGCRALGSWSQAARTRDAGFAPLTGSPVHVQRDASSWRASCWRVQGPAHCAKSRARTARQLRPLVTAGQCSSSATPLKTPSLSSGTLAPTETSPIPGMCRSSPRQSWPPSPAGSACKSEGCDREEG